VIKKCAIALIMLGLIPLSSCQTPTNDRINGNKAEPDTYSDVTNVIVYRNANIVPNVATFCVGHYGFASTLNGGGDGSRGPSLVRFPELDKGC
jgi:hypothetical protein